MNLTIAVEDMNGNCLAQVSDTDEVELIYQNAYQMGDRISIHSDEKEVFLNLKIDDAMETSFVYLKTNELVYEIPFGDERNAYSPKAFYGNLHVISVCKASEEEMSGYKNLALNVYDQNKKFGCFPHAVANVHTRNEAVFAPRCVIDGCRSNTSHGPWPFQSWGINMQDDAYITVEFGRNVRIDQIRLYTRSDFPHDNWWEKATLVFSDGTELDWQLKKSSKAHVLHFPEKEVEWVRLEKLIKAEDPSPFPALSQFEIYGRDVIG